MTKKHFIALADALRERRPLPHWDANKHVQWEHDVEVVANVCHRFNTRFNRELWLRYVKGECGPNGGAR